MPRQLNKPIEEFRVSEETQLPRTRCRVLDRLSFPCRHASCGQGGERENESPSLQPNLLGQVAPCLSNSRVYVFHSFLDCSSLLKQVECEPAETPLFGNSYVSESGKYFLTRKFLTPHFPKQGSQSASVAEDVTRQTEDCDALRRCLSHNEALLEENRTLRESLRRESISSRQLKLALQNEVADIQQHKFEQIIGRSSVLQRTLIRVEQVASTDATVLITGETGTGKELIAQAIHKNSKRGSMPFRSINCAALPVTLMAAELFGYERGAFTGADRQRVGQFELSAGGTLFLDEIAEISIEMQAMLLRVLEERTFERLGGAKPIVADVRVIAATNRDLHAAMRAGEFRPDLFYRLNTFPIELAPLRERRDDIPVLATHFIALSAAKYGKTIRGIEKRAMELLQSYDWPGNIRELRNVIDTSVIIGTGEVLSIEEELLLGKRSVEDAPLGSLQKEMANHERMLIERALTARQGRISGPSGAATTLHLPPSTLSARMKALKIDVSKFKPQSA